MYQLTSTQIIPKDYTKTPINDLKTTIKLMYLTQGLQSLKQELNDTIHNKNTMTPKEKQEYITIYNNLNTFINNYKHRLKNQSITIV
ncbi:hypothetical protein [Bacteroides sp.]|uniref:hypothetical protein n=1 Tax=Bacteroides sp. TaxID=29523 RepID=UPI002634369E|nr:hypothetical protein [Bacteroides sp.]MDD3039052.1 hypothetical protein [Bacteroides sp.]